MFRPFETFVPTTALLAVVFASGCSTSVSPNLVKTKAAADFGCKAADLQVTKVTDNNWSAEGCGKKSTYVCSGSNFMSDGMCMREGDPAKL
ncbi:MAG: hypothetical protein U0169_09425 [Polyangiaceae bacterium]